MSRYFGIITGLRGGYMPDSNHIHRVDSRRQLKDIIANEARMQAGDALVTGLSQRMIAWATAHAWAKGSMGAIMPWGYRGQGKPYLIEIYISSRKDWLEQENTQ